jgi:hypothetical protein
MPDAKTLDRSVIRHAVDRTRLRRTYRDDSSKAAGTGASPSVLNLDQLDGCDSQLVRGDSTKQTPA